MALQLRKRQQDAIHRMLNLNVSRVVPLGEREAEETEVYKILVMDRHCFDVITPLVRVNELRRHGVTLHLLLDNERQPIHDVPAVYFVAPSAHNVARITADFAAGLYEAYHLNFSSSLPRPMLEELAAGSVKANAAGKVAKVFDQYADFVSLSEDIFSLAQRDAYVALNDPTAKDADVENAVSDVVKGLLSVCASSDARAVAPRRWSHSSWRSSCGTTWRRAGPCSRTPTGSEAHPRAPSSSSSSVTLTSPPRFSTRGPTPRSSTTSSA